MNQCNRGRRLAVVALAACAIASAMPQAAAQDPTASAAHLAALDWLKLADANDANGTYDTAAKRFHDAMPAGQWASAMAQAREQFGSIETRTLLSAQPPKPGPEVPPGEFMVLIFRTEFAKRKTGTETLTLEKESDGKWRVVGYLMR
jgi:hypothetical protein